MRTREQIKSAIAVLVVSAAKMQADIHELALECVAHAEAHGDATLLDHLVKELEAKAPGQRTETLKAWVQKYSPIRWNAKGEVALQKKDTNKDYTEFDLEGAASEPYYSMGLERKPVELTFESMCKQLNGMLARIERAEKGEGKTRIAEGEDIDKMKTLAKRAAMAASSLNSTDTTTDDNDETPDETGADSEEEGTDTGPQQPAEAASA